MPDTMIQERTVPEFHRVEPRLSLTHFPPATEQILTPEDAVQFVCKYLLNQSCNERLIALYFDVQLHPVCYSILSEGYEDHAITGIRSILTPALLYGVSRILIIHNHPSGNGKPSDADYRFSYNAYHQCREFGMLLLDSIVMPCGQDPDAISYTSIGMEKRPDNPWLKNADKSEEKHENIA